MPINTSWVATTEFGRYCTYCPPIDGVTPGKFVLHPWAEADRKREDLYS